MKELSLASEIEKDIEDRLTTILNNANDEVLGLVNLVELKKLLFELKIDIGCLSQTAEIFKDEDATNCVKSKVIDFQKSISEQEKELTRVDNIENEIQMILINLVREVVKLTLTKLKHVSVDSGVKKDNQT